MALGGITVTWDTATPSGTSTAGTLRNDLLSLKTTLNQVLDSEHVFSAITAITNAGVHRKGSAVIHYGASSAVSSTDTNGRLMLDSTNTRLWHVGSDTTFVVGGRYVVEGSSVNTALGTGTAVPIGEGWIMECGQFEFQNGSSSTIFPLQQTYNRQCVAVCSPVVSHVTLGGWPAVNVTPALDQLTCVNYALGTGTYGASTNTYWVSYLVLGGKTL